MIHLSSYMLLARVIELTISSPKCLEVDQLYRLDGHIFSLAQFRVNVVLIDFDKLPVNGFHCTFTCYLYGTSVLHKNIDVVVLY